MPNTPQAGEREKVNEPAAPIREPQSFTQEGLRDFPADTRDGPPGSDDEEGDPWETVDPNEHGGPSAGKAKATHVAPPAKPAAAEKAAPAASAPPKAAFTGTPSAENAEEGTIRPQHSKGQVKEYRYCMEENVKGQIVEHVIIDSHPYELITRSCWQRDGATEFAWPWRLQWHATKVNAVTRGQPGRNTSKFDENMWMELDDFFKEFNLMLPKRVNAPTVTELLALLAHDNKCRFEFRCVAGLQSATRKGLAYWPFKIRAVQGHSEKAVQKDTFNATLVYAGGSVALSKISLTGRPRATMEETPGVIYHRTARGNWKGILDEGLIPGGGDRVSSGRAHNYFSDKQVAEKGYVSGVRAQRPIEIRVAMREAVLAGLVFIKTASDGILTKDTISPQFILSVEDTDNKTNLYVRHDATEQAARSTGADKTVKQHIAALEGSRKPTPPPKAEAPKASPRSEAQKAKSPRSTIPKVESPRPALPKAKAETPHAIAAATTEEPAQKKAALIGAPKAAPAAKPPAAPPATAKSVEVSAKPPPNPKEMATTALKSHGAGSTPKSLGKETTPKQMPAATEQKPVAVKIEVGSCSPCFAQTFKGQIQCNVCGLTLEDASKAPRTKIAERRKAGLQKLGVRYDSKGEFLKKITDEQLAGMGLLGDQLRGSTSRRPT